MDEATRSLYEPPAALQGWPAGAVMTEAKRLARDAVKAQCQARGLKFYTTEPSEIAKAVRAHLDRHRAELINQAVENLRRGSGRFLPQIRTLAARIEQQ